MIIRKSVNGYETWQENAADGGIGKSMRYSEEKASSLTINERKNSIGKKGYSLKPEDARKLLQP
jgi:hypothetical protein